MHAVGARKHQYRDLTPTYKPPDLGTEYVPHVNSFCISIKQPLLRWDYLIVCRAHRLPSKNIIMLEENVRHSFEKYNDTELQFLQGTSTVSLSGHITLCNVSRITEFTTKQAMNIQVTYAMLSTKPSIHPIVWQTASERDMSLYLLA